MNLRNILFWKYDKLTGKLIGKHYQQIFEFFESSEEDRHKIQSELLENLLNYVKKNVVNYSSQSFIELKEFPVVDKNIIRNNSKNFISKQFSIDKLTPIVTSGSTGTPFRIYQNIDKRKRNSADTIYFAAMTGYEVGQRVIYMKIWAKQKMKSPVYYYMQNVIPVDVIKLSDEQLEKLMKRISGTKQSYNIVAYSSALERLYNYLQKNYNGRLDINMNSLISTSESLTDEVKFGFEKYFGKQVYSRYSNLENGIIAQQTKGSPQKFLINSASYIVEILKINSNEQAKEGELGRIVVTDLFNYAQPMIRYDTGDIGSKYVDENGYEYLSKIEGRKLDLLYDTKGELVSSYIVYKNMWQYTEINQYQLIQDGKKEYIFKINHDGSFNREEKIRNEFKEYLGDDAVIKFKYVDEIPLLSSGKRKKIVNNYYNSSD